MSDELDRLGEVTGPATMTGTEYQNYLSASPNLSGLTSLLTPFKGIFDRLKSGSTTANDVNAALGVLGLIMPSLNRPQTAGWKGSIDLNKQFTRTPIAQPEYKPYAQSASPVMGRQFFTSTYGAAPAAPPAAGGALSPPATPPATNPDLDSPSSTGGKAKGGIASLRKFAAGGATGSAINMQSRCFGGDKPVELKALNDIF